LLQQIVNNVRKAVVGKEDTVRKVILALACGRHVLIEDVPGVGKTTLIKALAQSVNLSFRRVQFTPDLLPTDITGTSVLKPDDSTFEFRKGPVFNNIILADEINRASPKTQSALLECMQEGQVTADGTTHALPNPFLVMATQNPIEYEGTFPLPEAQLDRFAMSLKMGYPTDSGEKDILRLMQYRSPLENLKAVAESDDIEQVRQAVDEIHASDAVLQYIINISSATREHDGVYLGASPRASLTLLKLSQAYALYEEMDYVIPDHVKSMAPDVLRHRLILTPEARWEDETPDAVIDRILRHTEVPGVGK